MALSFREQIQTVPSYYKPQSKIIVVVVVSHKMAHACQQWKQKQKKTNDKSERERERI